MNYRPGWDLSTIPLDKLKSEWARRNAMKPRRNTCGHDPAQPETCPKCRERLRLREYRSKQRKKG